MKEEGRRKGSSEKIGKGKEEKISRESRVALVYRCVVLSAY